MSNARSIGKVVISFGLVSIPSQLYPATSESQSIKFNLLDPQGGRLRQQYVNGTGQVVERASMIKGFEFSKDQFVTFTAEELKSMEEAGSHTAEIIEFVPAESVDAIFFDKPYFVAPDVGGAKPYSLLLRALRESGRVALGKWAARGKGHVVMIRATPDGLVMQQLLYSTEVRSMKDLSIPVTEVKDAELKLALQLIEAQASDSFKPETYTDEVAVRIRAAVEKKIAGEAITMLPSTPARAQVVDLAEALRASLAKKPKAAPAPKEAPKAAKTKKAA